MYFHEKAEQGTIFTEEDSIRVGISFEFKSNQIKSNPFIAILTTVY
jgi:hypothetical protein